VNKKRIHITGVGGQGTLIATALIGQAAVLAGINANMSEIHGMAQRGGIVESAVTLGDLKDPMVSRGEADILLGFEPAETLRAASRCNSGSVVITNTVPLPPFTVSTGREEYPDVAPALGQLETRVGKLVRLDADDLARKAGNIVTLNIVMLGALARHGDLPMTQEQFREAIRKNTKSKFLEMNLKAFELGYAA
jgi:indolepyruvate ferredoxin oxidoreductase beta subunit